MNWHSSEPFQGDYTEEYQAYYHEELIKQFFTRKYMWATHVWNMFDMDAPEGFFSLNDKMSDIITNPAGQEKASAIRGSLF